MIIPFPVVQRPRLVETSSAYEAVKARIAQTFATSGARRVDAMHAAAKDLMAWKDRTVDTVDVQFALEQLRAAERSLLAKIEGK